MPGIPGSGRCTQMDSTVFHALAQVLKDPKHTTPTPRGGLGAKYKLTPLRARPAITTETPSLT
eukprot:141946-Alexandrium_andersonii.AAC.1